MTTFNYPISFTKQTFTAVCSSYTSTTGASIGSGFVWNITNKSCQAIHERSSGYTIIVLGK